MKRKAGTSTAPPTARRRLIPYIDIPSTRPGPPVAQTNPPIDFENDSDPCGGPESPISTSSSISLGEPQCMSKGAVDEPGPGSTRTSRSGSEELEIEQYYHRHPEEILESEVLIDVDDEVEAEKDDASLPERALDDFYVYKLDTKRLLTVDFNTDHVVQGASGIASPILLGDGEEVGDDGVSSDGGGSTCAIRVCLSQILEVWWDPNLDDYHIWIRTKYAWYRLEQPSTTYHPYFCEIGVANAVSWILDLACQEEDLSWDGFLETVQDYGSYEGVQYAVQLLGHAWSVAYAEGIQANQRVIDRLLDLAMIHKRIRRSSLMCELLGSRMPKIPIESEDEMLSEDGLGPTRASGGLRPRKPKVQKQSRPRRQNMEQEVLKHKHITYFTPVVSSIAQGLFYRSLLVTGEDPGNVDEQVVHICDPVMPLEVHLCNPLHVIWDKEKVYRDGDGTFWYQSVIIDGVKYSINDTVAMFHEQMKDDPDVAPWIGIIKNLFEKDAKKSCHVQWFSHGSDTILGETANPKELFLLNECDDNPLSSIIQKVTVQRVKNKEKSHDQGMFDTSQFYFSYLWDKKQVAFVNPDANRDKINLILENTAPFERCEVCAVSLLEDELLHPEQWPRSEQEFSAHGVIYHIYDFVYVCCPSSSQLAIAQLLRFHNKEVQMEVVVFAQFYEASDEKVLSPLASHPVKASQLRGHCFVKHQGSRGTLALWLDSDHHYITSDSSLLSCDICNAELEEQAKYLEQLSLNPLSVMELFAGAGGLSTGFAFANAVETKWAVEFSPSAAQTFANNHPTVTVFNQETNTLLKHTIQSGQGTSTKPLKSLVDHNELPSMPKPGEVDIIIGGPPCQSFSGSNRNKKVDDIRHTLIPNMISYVEFYRPKYFLLENVLGLLYFRLRGRQQGRRIEGGIKAGMVKFIMRSLTELGYQVQVGILNSACYGSPQSRQRVIFWAAQLGVLLPKFPSPTHVISRGRKAMDTWSLPGDVHVQHPKLFAHLEVDGYDAPHKAVTVQDALDDLPGFEWESPCQIIKETPKSAKDASGLPLPKFVATTKGAQCSFVGFPDPEPYAHNAHHPYQVWSRRSQGDTVSMHFTGVFSDTVVEKTTWIPFERGADHTKLPRKLREDTGSSGKKDGLNRPGTYTRLDPNGLFKTAMTIVQPSLKNVTVIHPTQRRILTVREAARAQGFPDHYDFVSKSELDKDKIDDFYRQIGNAVPVPLGRALGLGLQETMIGHMSKEKIEFVRESDSPEL